MKQTTRQKYIHKLKNKTSTTSLYKDREHFFKLCTICEALLNIKQTL